MERYRNIGQEPVISILPKAASGTEVAVGPYIDHKIYLETSNNGSHAERFKDNTVRSFEVNKKGHEIITVPRSSYVEAPGSMHIMLVAVGQDSLGRERSIPAFSDFSTEQGEAHFSFLGQIAKVLPERYGKRWFMGTSINPDEWNRQAVQSIKTIHTHVIGMRGEEFIPLSEVENLSQRAEMRRALADSATTLGTSLLREIVFTEDFWQTYGKGLVSATDVSLHTQFPKGYTFTLPSVDAIGDPRFFALTKAIDERIRNAYKELAGVLTVPGAKDPMKRPVLRDDIDRTSRIYAYASQKGLHVPTYRRLVSLSSLLKSGVEEVSLAGDNISAQIYRANTRLFLKGRAYNYMIFPAQDGSNSVHISIVPRALSGGSPLDAMGIYKDQYLTAPEFVEKIIQRHTKVAEEVTEEAFPNTVNTLPSKR